jgi:hypothetical protein
MRSWGLSQPGWALYTTECMFLRNVSKQYEAWALVNICAEASIRITKDGIPRWSSSTIRGDCNNAQTPSSGKLLFQFSLSLSLSPFINIPVTKNVKLAAHKRIIRFMQVSLYILLSLLHPFKKNSLLIVLSFFWHICSFDAVPVSLRLLATSSLFTCGYQRLLIIP